MKNPIFYIALIVVVLCISPVTAATVLNSIYTGSLTPGASGTHVMRMTADTAGEVGTVLTVGMDGGNCSRWVTLDKKSVTLSKDGEQVTAKIKVPADAYNGDYRCSLQYTSPAAGLVQAVIEVPFKMAITGGNTAPVQITTAATVPTTMQITTTTAGKTTMTAPVQEEGMGGFVPLYAMGYGVVGFIALMFVIVLIHDYRRGYK